jgi:peptidoglycan/LPS O-acetylase OafA/YrhL
MRPVWPNGFAATPPPGALAKVTRKTPANLPRLHFLDSLRGVAALQVVALHLLYARAPSPPLATWQLRRIVEFGHTGVFLFFLISGFSLSLTMPRHDRTPRPAASYAISRIFRIVPLFYFIVAVSLVRSLLETGSRPGASEIALNMAMVFNLVPWRQSGIAWASWTISVEMLFYAIFLPIFRLKTKHKIAITLFCAGATAIVGPLLDWLFPRYALLEPVVPGGYFYFFAGGFISLFVLGMLAHDAYVALQRVTKKKSLGRWMIFASLAVLLLAAMVHGGGNFHFRPLVALAYGVLLTGCGLCHPRILDARILRFHGAISYSVYLVHPLVIYFLASAYGLIIQSVPASAAYVSCLALTYVVVTGVAYCTYRVIEMPGIRLGERLRAALPSRRAAASTGEHQSRPDGTDLSAPATASPDRAR